jgi:hypothetical protein
MAKQRRKQHPAKQPPSPKSAKRAVKSAVGIEDRKPRPPLKPLKADKGLYVLENLERDPAEEQRFWEAVVQETTKLESQDKPA